MYLMFQQIKEFLYIIEGYSKWLYDKIFNKESEKAKRRYQICCNCEHKKHGICELCGCVLKAKVRVDFLEDENGITYDGCPEKKW